MADGTDPRVEIGVALALIVAAATVLWESRAIPPGTFEPLGSAPIPQAVAGLIILLSVSLIGRAWLALRRGAEGDAPDLELRPLDAAAVFALTAVYVFAMQLRLIDFAPLTTVFLILAIGFLIRFQPRLLPLVVVIALIVGFGCQWIFTRVFVVDLPGL